MTGGGGGGGVVVNFVFYVLHVILDLRNWDSHRMFLGTLRTPNNFNETEVCKCSSVLDSKVGSVSAPLLRVYNPRLTVVGLAGGQSVS